MDKGEFKVSEFEYYLISELYLEFMNLPFQSPDFTVPFLEQFSEVRQFQFLLVLSFDITAHFLFCFVGWYEP